jgi:hypothetical protein
MNLTRWIIVGVVAIVGAIDIVLAIYGGMNATISFNITQWSHQYPAIPFAFGFLMGHFFAQNKM